jgi:hypothetical protein
VLRVTTETGARVESRSPRDNGLFSGGLLGVSMSEVPDRVRRAFVDHSGFEAGPAGDYVSTATPFDARVTVEPADGGAVDERTPHPIRYIAHTHSQQPAGEKPVVTRRPTFDASAGFCRHAKHGNVFRWRHV